MEEAWFRQRLGPIRLENEIAELRLSLGQCLLALLASETAGDVQVDLPLVAAEVQHLEGAEWLILGLARALHLDEPLARRVDRELAEVGDDPFAADLFGYCGGHAAAAEEVGDKIAFVRAGSDNALDQGLRLLRRIVEIFP